VYLVVFKAKAGVQDDTYSDTVAQLRKLAFEQYGCLEFIAVTEGEQEIALSYWPTEEHILAWKQDGFHQIAQQKGRESWYQSYTVEIAEIKRQYSFAENNE